MGNQTTLACRQYIGIGILGLLHSMAAVSNLNISGYVSMLWIGLRNLYVEKKMALTGIEIGVTLLLAIHRASPLSYKAQQNPRIIH
jgi:hypothetical protein